MSPSALDTCNQAGVTHLHIAMTKREVLEIFSQSARFETPDAICRQLGEFRQRSSVYSYLFRLHKQGLLSRGEASGRLAYRISQRGIERLRFLRAVDDTGTWFANEMTATPETPTAVQAQQGLAAPSDVPGHKR
jgi:Fe2+ or Zn2+ uptake regulation protein